MKMKKLLTLFSAVIITGSMTANVYADTLLEKDGVKYRISDGGDNMGLYTGWTSREGKRYYYKDGKQLKNCWLTAGGEKKYYLTGSGEAATGKLTISGVEYEFDGSGEIIYDKWGITLSIDDVSATGCTAVFSRKGGSCKDYLNAAGHALLERFENEEWTAVKTLSMEHSVVWDVETKFITEEEPACFSHDWQWLYGELSPGKYRIAMDVTDNSSFFDDDTVWYTADFEIE